MRDWFWILGMTNTVWTPLSLSDSDIILTTLSRTMLWYTQRGNEFLKSPTNSIDYIAMHCHLLYEPEWADKMRKWMLARFWSDSWFLPRHTFFKKYNKLQQWTPGPLEWRGQSGDRGLGTIFSLPCPTINTRGATSAMQVKFEANVEGKPRITSFTSTNVKLRILLRFDPHLNFTWPPEHHLTCHTPENHLTFTCWPFLTFEVGHERWS